MSVLRSDVRLLRGLGAANFCAALGGGTVLSRCMGVLADYPVLKGDSLLALLCGTLTGFFIVCAIRRAKYAFRPSHFAGATALFSSILLILLMSEGRPERFSTGIVGWTFFFVLVVRWSTWYVGRALRADLCARRHISFPELLYYAGMVLGLLSSAWMSLTVILVLDVVLQAVSAVIDFLSVRDSEPIRTSASPHRNRETSAQVGPYIRATLMIAATTISIQIIVFAFAHQLKERNEPQLSSQTPARLLACFYAGAAGAAIFNLIAGSALRFRSSMHGWGRIIRGRLLLTKKIRHALPLWPISATATAFTVVAICLPPSPFPASQILVAAASILLGIVTLNLHGWIGRLGARQQSKKLVALSFGFMGASGACALVIFVQICTSPASLAIASGVLGLLALSVTLRVPRVMRVFN